ncbi:F-box domain-containing protein [Favolaschia claudopus]|uniref:F-box domain-containing protein n=1 Tax=Favolaschia claudopus TaxID=2862362 RepID=A0AAV9ZX73_9AGAR
MTVVKGSIRSPILEIPYELTSQIFLCCLPSNKRISPDPKAAPLVLAQICSHWRKIAVSIPELWNSFYLEFKGTNQYDGIRFMLNSDPRSASDDSIVALVDCWLSRAANLPLSITIVSSDTSRLLPPRLIPLLATKSLQWARIELQILPPDIHQFGAIPGPFPLLQTLALDTTVRLPTLQPVLNAALFLDSPNLQALRLGRFGWLRFPDLPPNSVPSVTALELWAENRSSSMFQKLHSFPGLRHLKLHSSVFTFQQSVLSLPSIESLILHVRDTRVLRYLCAPSLRRLEFHARKSTDAELLPSFVERSACVLTTLHIRMPEGWDGLYECLLATPSLVDLAISMNECNSAVDQLETLCIPEILGALRVLKLRVSSCLGLYHAFVSVLDALGVTLAEVDLLVEDTMPCSTTEELARLTQWRERGMRISIRSGLDGEDGVENDEEYDIWTPEISIPRCFAPFDISLN